jgi:hypothetical protein
MLPGYALVGEQQCLGQFSITRIELFVFVIWDPSMGTGLAVYGFGKTTARMSNNNLTRAAYFY